MGRRKVVDERNPPPRTLEVTIVAQDPTVLDKRSNDRGRRILRAKVKVPADRLEPGPWGPRFHVVDYDATTGTYLKPAKQTVPVDGADLTDRQMVSDAGFRAWNVYAVAARTLAAFEFALGRPVPWAFGSHQLYLVPTAFAEENAYYAGDDQALFFGYFPERGGRTAYTCLSHDIVAHETTHAILDGLRSGFDLPGLPDQAAFHEGFADVVALLLVFSVPEVVETLIGDPRRKRLNEADVSGDRLARSALLKLGEQLGDAVHVKRGEGLRRSVALEPTTEWRDPANLEWQVPHRRGEILVAAVTHTLVLMWRQRLEALVHGGTLDRQRAAEEGSKSARHLLEMAIRAIDYCPPVDFEYEDFLNAVLVSDAEVAPDDAQNYRGALREAFGRFGIEPAPPPAEALTHQTDRMSFRDFSFQALRADRDEVFRFIWDNAASLGIDPAYHLRVEAVSPSTRIGPNGFVVNETVVNYVQQLGGTAAELRSAAPDLRLPEGLAEDTKIKVYGGGTLIFDQFGVVKHHHAKPLADWDRQSRRLEYLVSQGQSDTRGAIGSSLGVPAGQRFAQIHQSDENSSEEW
ncbi:MAG TPA: hypothetical protein DGG94_06675 [Micromonosporaceae bacterium]|nr:hypothetical protein [Micromonosporaceae bacterium]